MSTQPQALWSDYQVDEQTRASIKAELPKHYPELADLKKKEEEPFSIARLFLAHAQRRAFGEREEEVTRAAALMLGQRWDGHRTWVPLTALRTMTTTLGSKGGYIVGMDTVTPVDVLAPWSVVASAGAMMMNGLIDNVLIPRTTVDTTVTWIGEPSVGPSEAPPSLGNVSMTPKTAIALVNVSYQLLKQGIAAEPFIRALLLRAAGQALDRAYFGGVGGVEPLGMHSTVGVGSVAGASLDHADTLAMRKVPLSLGAREEALRWVGDPATQEVLGGRQRFTDSDRTIWDDGRILGLPAHATKNAPTGTLTVGDFSTSAVGVWGPGIRIDVDPSQNFASAGLVARVMLMCDVAFPRPEAFSVATAVT